MPAPFTIKIESSGTINGVQFEGTGAGKCDTSTGRITFGATFSEVAEGTTPFGNLLGVLIIPTVFGREIGEARNLMTLTDGNFAFTQVIAGDGIHVRSHGHMSRTGESEVTWRSAGQGQVKLGSVTAIEPFAALMLPQGAGKIVDVVAIPLVEGGKRRTLHALRHFTFTPRAELKVPQLRHITVIPQVDGKTVNVDINSTISLFDHPD
jgi:hypothetical protein